MRKAISYLIALVIAQGVLAQPTLVKDINKGVRPEVETLKATSAAWTGLPRSSTVHGSRATVACFSSTARRVSSSWAAPTR